MKELLEVLELLTRVSRTVAEMSLRSAQEERKVKQEAEITHFTSPAVSNSVSGSSTGLQDERSPGPELENKPSLLQSALASDAPLKRARTRSHSPTPEPASKKVTKRDKALFTLRPDLPTTL